ncbi:MAG: type II and III secretion system protein family protein [Hyphomonadaceae bacterium]|nr:type II and III secretion system protein family protein [Hyphomonadaceae bacterium]
MGRFTLKRSLLVCAASLAMAGSLTGTTSAQTPPVNSAAEIQLALNKSRIVTADRPFTELSVGNSAVADVVALSRTQFYILGKSVGSTNVIVSDREGSVIGIYDVAIGYDVDGLKRKIFEVNPNDAVEVRAANDSIVLSGTVADAGHAASIASLAERYAPGKITNMIGVTGSQQVMLEVKFAEVQRSALKDIGTQLELTDLDAGEFGAITLDGLNPLNYVAGAFSLVEAGDFRLDFAFDMLEQKGLVRTLAEPNMVALSGDTAKFLAGGEFPIPVAQSSGSGASGVGTAITVEFKEFGVGLAFTPTVTGKDSINLELSAEVSSIDPTVSTTLGNISIPGLKVRRTNTTVELRDGQSFAIAGLIQDDLTNQIRAIPGLGSVPILGALARSEEFERRQTELVVLITARLVKPVSGKQLAAPTDTILPPSEVAFFMFGKPEAVRPAGASGGIDGTYGYVQP